jgi:hypothetical protein
MRQQQPKPEGDRDAREENNLSESRHVRHPCLEWMMWIGGEDERETKSDSVNRQRGSSCFGTHRRAARRLQQKTTIYYVWPSVVDCGNGAGETIQLCLADGMEAERKQGCTTCVGELLVSRSTVVLSTISSFDCAFDRGLIRSRALLATRNPLAGLRPVKVVAGTVITYAQGIIERSAYMFSTAFASLLGRCIWLYWYCRSSLN